MKCCECHRKPVQYLLVFLNSGTHFMTQCVKHRVEPHPVILELTPLQVLGLSKKFAEA